MGSFGINGLHQHVQLIGVIAPLPREFPHRLRQRRRVHLPSRAKFRHGKRRSDEAGPLPDRHPLRLTTRLQVLSLIANFSMMDDHGFSKVRNRAAVIVKKAINAAAKPLPGDYGDEDDPSACLFAMAQKFCR